MGTFVLKSQGQAALGCNVYMGGRCDSKQSSLCKGRSVRAYGHASAGVYDPRLGDEGTILRAGRSNVLSLSRSRFVVLVFATGMME